METYTEAYRYLDNAKEILRSKAKKRGKFYNDIKYVRMACNTGYSGLLVALDDFFRTKGIKMPPQKGKRKQAVSVDFYKQNLAKLNKTKLKEFNSAYSYLHLYGGYDGDLLVDTSKNGLELAQSIIDWIDKQMN
jgi:hypothetical protein